MISEDAQSDHARLARSVVESLVLGESPPDLESAAEELRKQRAGVFVCLKKDGQLRGCIGTIEPAAQNVAQEIRNNALGSATRDPRFPPVTPDELDSLTYSVDVLGEPEEISGISELDPAKYGVIVCSGAKSGLLLPDLEGVDTAEEQVRIAAMKAGIAPGEPISLERFTVTRYD